MIRIPVTGGHAAHQSSRSRGPIPCPPRPARTCGSGSTASAPVAASSLTASTTTPDSSSHFAKARHQCTARGPVPNLRLSRCRYPRDPRRCFSHLSAQAGHGNLSQPNRTSPGKHRWLPFSPSAGAFSERGEPDGAGVGGLPQPARDLADAADPGLWEYWWRPACPYWSRSKGD